MAECEIKISQEEYQMKNGITKRVISLFTVFSLLMLLMPFLPTRADALGVEVIMKKVSSTTNSIYVPWKAYPNATHYVVRLGKPLQNFTHSWKIYGTACRIKNLKSKTGYMIGVEAYKGSKCIGKCIPFLQRTK